MSALGDLVILAASCFVACLFWTARQRMGRAVEGTRLIAMGLFILSVSAAFDASEILPMVDKGVNEVIGYTGYTISCAFLVLGFMRWLPVLARLDGEVAGRARAEAEYHAALERSRRFNAGLEALGRAHLEEGWDRKALSAETARRVSALLGCARVSIWRLEPGGEALVCETLFDARSRSHEAGARIERTVNPAYFDAIESGRAVCVNDALSDMATRAFGPAYLEPLGIGALMDAPIHTGRGVHGVVCCEHVGGPRSWSPDEVSLVSGAAQYVAVAYLADNAETLAANLTQALTGAETASAAKSTFLANTSHELRTPLNGVIGMAQVLADETSDPDQADKIAVIIQSGALLLGVLNDLLDLSKIEAGRMDILPEPLDPAALIRQTGQLFQVAAAQKGIGLEISLDPLPEQINADSVRLRQILSNLVANAIKFTDSGTVEIRARAERSGARWRLRVCVEDTGCGISAEDQGRLFARFGQADQSRTRRYGGAGLGLVIARELAQRMEGDVTLESTPGEGSRFTLTLLADAAHETASAAPTPRRVDGLEGRQILLVDDNEVNRMVARCFLEPSGAIITEASGGDEALALFQDQRFDLILLDAHMPGMSGLDVLAQVRKRPGGADIPVIALTADALPGDEARYLKAGMDGYVSKPVDKQILLKACADLASGRRSSTEDTQRRA